MTDLPPDPFSPIEEADAVIAAKQDELRSAILDEPTMAAATRVLRAAQLLARRLRARGLWGDGAAGAGDGGGAQRCAQRARLPGAGLG